VGSSILLLHDSSDVFLESAKVFNYTSKAKGHGWAKLCCDIFFACFAVTFLVTRLVIFPRYIIFSVFFEAPNHFGTKWAGFWFFCLLLVVLQILHIFWFYLIAKMIYRLVSTGIEKDERSDDDEEIGEDCPPESERGGSGKGSGSGNGSSNSSKKGN
jgi:ceramide synthetase